MQSLQGEWERQLNQEGITNFYYLCESSYEDPIYSEEYMDEPVYYPALDNSSFPFVEDAIVYNWDTPAPECEQIPFVLHVDAYKKPTTILDKICYSFHRFKKKINECGKHCHAAWQRCKWSQNTCECVEEESSFNYSVTLIGIDD